MLLHAASSGVSAAQICTVVARKKHLDDLAVGSQASQAASVLMQAASTGV
jgi:hypothetical protein